MGRITERLRVRRIRAEFDTARVDTVAVEEPLEIRVGGASMTMTMRTPGDDVDLVHGLLLAEGLITSGADIDSIRYCAGTDDHGQNTYNVVDVIPADGVALEIPARTFASTSACGVCGKASIDELRVRSHFDLTEDPTPVATSALTRMSTVLRDHQKTFAATGGVHGAALFTADGALLVSREDVGRHNAVDKVIGWAVRNEKLPLRGTVLMVSSRASFEICQKAVLAGIPVLAAVSAPSSLAVEVGRESGLTVVGFLRDTSMNVYSGPDRIVAGD
ncbi:formate dehydrogenase accessory sulfurtransferase FdhD [Williamsia sterculiae]|uniref:Sulfur carrier protein FdhD n=1 Tax=Williamsia sterculiae TaxID=1344003 RepID=A0A1N7GJZ9_9NOCA|nr:formate dehydrogenase accessory sulfurtransferase FdhD [Williamsia sterculiae]SIS12836.1 FdhD protein [Williamsia sterculiae]